MNFNNISNNEAGKRRINWAHNFMPVLHNIEKRFEEDNPFENKTICACLHVTIETANLLLAIKAGGAKVHLCACKNAIIQDDVAEALNKEYGITVLAKKDQDIETHYKHLMNILDKKPNITIDDGAELITTIHSERQDLLENYYGGIEETRSGVLNIQNLADMNNLKKPIIDVNLSKTKEMFDSFYGTSQSVIQGLIQATNILIAGKKFAVIGYGNCGKGIAEHVKALGAHVYIVENNAIKALKAIMDGYNVLNIEEASKICKIFCTSSGNNNILRKEHFSNMQNNSIIFNAGRTNEINVQDLENISTEIISLNEHIDRFILNNGVKLNLLCNGKVINLTAAEGHPSAVMDISFANQALAVEFLSEQHEFLESKIYGVPDYIDESIAKIKLDSLGISI